MAAGLPLRFTSSRGQSATGIGPGGYLLLLERGEQEELFVGQLSVDPEKQEQLLSNLIRRKLKGPPALGRYCSLSEFAGFEALVAQESLNRLAKTLDWAGHPADRVFTSVEPLSRTSEDTPAEDENSLFLNLSSRLAFRQREDAEMPVSDRRQGSTPLNLILHLKVDPSVASSEFMVHWFNDTRIGNYVFGAHGSLSMFQRIRRRELLASTIYLPLSKISTIRRRSCLSRATSPKSLNWKANFGTARTGRRHSRADQVT